MRTELVRIHREVETTMVFVTHDQEEAMAIADRIGIMRAGELIQLGPPLDVYRRPRNLWVAQFIGAHPINVIEASLAADGARLLPDGSWPVAVETPMRSLLQKVTDGKIVVGVRPEHVSVASADRAPGANRLPAEIYTRQILGTDILYELTSNGHILRAVTPTSQLFEIGDRVAIGFDWADAFVFDPSSGDALV
jgi:ABC-type sugar transport system ATPase subunit